MLCYSAPIIGRLFFHKTVSYVLQRLSFASRGSLRDLFQKRSQWITGQEKMEDLFVRFIPNLSLIHKVVSSTLIAIYICPNKNKVNKQNNKIIELIWSCTSFCYYCNHAHSQKKQGQQNLHQIQSPHHNCYSWGPVSITSFFFSLHLFHGHLILFGAMRTCFHKCDLLLFAPSLGARCLPPTHHHWAVATFKFDLINLQAQLKSSPPTTIN